MRDALLMMVIAACLAAALRRPFVGLLAWAWFVLMTPHQLAYGVYGVPLNVVIAGVTIAAVFMIGEYRRFAFDRITALLFLFAFQLSLSQAFSLDPDHSALYFDRFIKVLVFVLLCAQMTTDKLRLHALVWMLVIGLGFFAVKGAAFTLATFGQFRVQGIASTLLEDNNHMGSALAMVLPMILYLRGEATKPAVRTALLALFAATVIAILGTQSRGAFVGLVVFAGFYWLRSKYKLSIIAGLTLLLVPAIAFMPAKWSERMSTIAEATQDDSFMGRVDAWVINTKLALAHPATGAGLRNSYQKPIAETVDPERAQSAKAAHSIYFEVLGGAGFVGLAIYLGLLGGAFAAANALHRRRGDPAIEPWAPRFGYHAQISLAVFCVVGGAVSMEMWEGYFIVVALTAAAARLARSPAPAGYAWSRLKRFRWRVRARGRSPSVRPNLR